MNSILQALCHNPLIRNFFLGLGKPLAASQQLCQQLDVPLVGAELQRLIHELFSGYKKPFNPHCFLYAMWNAAGHLAGYSQQDAHEFLMAVLNAMSMPPYNIADLVCKGTLQSNVLCMKCGNRSSVQEPFLDISLHLKAHHELQEHDENNEDDEETQVGQTKRLHSLLDCLNKYCFSQLFFIFERFTRKEKLEGDEYHCNKCLAKRTSTIQLTIQKLPIALTFHLKVCNSHNSYNIYQKSVLNMVQTETAKRVQKLIVL